MDQNPNENLAELEAFFLTCFQTQQQALEIFFQAQAAAQTVWAAGLPPQEQHEDLIGNYLDVQAGAEDRNAAAGEQRVIPVFGVLLLPASLQLEQDQVIAEPVERPLSPAPIQVEEVSSSMQADSGDVTNVQLPSRRRRVLAGNARIHSEEMENARVLELPRAASSPRKAPVRRRDEDVELGEPSSKRIVSLQPANNGNDS